MKLLNFIYRIVNKYKTLDDGRRKYIFYRIVDSKSEKYFLQTINTKVIIKLNIFEIVNDRDILFALHPIQACYIGIRYSMLSNKPFDYDRDSIFRYGKYRLCSTDRKGHLSFECRKTHKKFTMNPCDIARSKEYIEEFDAVQAFLIGVNAGPRIKKFNSEIKRPELIRVK